jgi:hypothetical protein
MDRSRLLCSPIAVATVVDADAHAVAAAAGELHGPERTAIGARPQRRASSPACRMMDRVVVIAYRGWLSAVESQLCAILFLVSVHTGSNRTDPVAGGLHMCYWSRLRSAPFQAGEAAASDPSCASFRSTLGPC